MSSKTCRNSASRKPRYPVNALFCHCSFSLSQNFFILYVLDFVVALSVKQSKQKRLAFKKDKPRCAKTVPDHSTER